MGRCVALLGLAVALAGCATTAGARGAAAVREELMAADRAFDLETAARGAAGWMDWFDGAAQAWTQEGLRPAGEVYPKRLDPLFASGKQLRWAPELAEGGAGYGYTTGRWRALKGDEVVAAGRYVTVWKRQAGGGWKVIFDHGDDDPPKP